MLQRQTISLDQERKLLMHLIMNTEFLHLLAPVMKTPRLLKSSYSRLVAQWILEYYHEFQRAPEKDIQEIYLQKRKSIEEEEDTRLISTLLTNLSTEYVQSHNVEYTAKQALEYLKQRNLEVLREDLDTSLASGDLLEAERQIAKYSRVEQQGIKGIDLLRDTGEILEAFNEESEFLFCFRGDLGKSIGPINRGDFFAFMAFAKRGKTFCLLHAMECALEYGNRVLFISLEMTKNQVQRRAWQSLAGRPRYSKHLRIPFLDVSEHADKKWSVQYREEFREEFPRDKEGIQGLQREVLRHFREGELKLEILERITVKELEAHLELLEHYENFIPDVVVIDYADLMSSTLKGEYRHQLDEIWKNLRQLARDRNIAVMTATQSNRGTAVSDVREDSASEDIRKTAHVTQMVGVNQSRRDKRKQIFRFIPLFERDVPAGEEVLVISCLDIGRIYLDSALLSEVEYEKEDPEEKRGPPNRKRLYNS